MRSFINTVLKTLFIVSILPIVSIILATAPSTNLMDFNDFDQIILAYYWSIPVTYIFSLIGFPAFLQSIFAYVLAALLPFTFLCVTIYWVIRKIVRTPSNQAIEFSIITSLVALEIPGFIIFALMASSINSQYPVYFRNIYVSPQPVVGQISKLYVEIASKQDESEVDFKVDFLEKYGNKIHLISGITDWHGDLSANQPKIFVMEICVTQEGIWPVHLAVGAVERPIMSSETIHIDSTLESSILIRSRNYTYSQDEAAHRPPPRSINFSAECSGK